MLTTEPPKPTRLNTGIRILDGGLGGGFERPCALLLFSRTPAEKRRFAEQFVMTGLRAGEPCLYVDFFRAPQLILRELGKFGTVEESRLRLVEGAGGSCLF